MPDASGLVECLLRTAKGRALDEWLADPGADLHVPSLCDVEVVSALRGLELREQIDGRRGTEALRDYLDLPLVRHDHETLLPRIFSLRRNLSAYDAAYLALAEGLGASLLSMDRPFVQAARAVADVDIVSLG